MRRQHVIGLAPLALAFGVIGEPHRAIADDPPAPAWAKKTSPWRPDLHDAGRGWWCSDVYCQRKQDDCEPTEEPCVRQARAWAFSWYSRLSHLWVASAHPTRERCEGMRGLEMTTEKSLGVSPCVSIGDRRPSRSQLPPGSGWWCHTLTAAGTGTTRTKCMRTQIECEDRSDYITGNARLRSEVTKACAPSRTAWMSEDLSDPSEPLFTFHATKEDCLQNGLSEKCRPVK